MMNVMFVVLANRALSNVIEEVNSKKFSLAPLARSRPSLICIIITINLELRSFMISCTFRGD